MSKSPNKTQITKRNKKQARDEALALVRSYIGQGGTPRVDSRVDRSADKLKSTLKDANDHPIGPRASKLRLKERISTDSSNLKSNSDLSDFDLDLGASNHTNHDNSIDDSVSGENSINQQPK